MFGSTRKRKLDEHAALLKLEPYGEAGEDYVDTDNELWLVSYADLMTLLFGFFVLMYVFATQNTAAVSTVKNELAKQFGATPKSYVAAKTEEIQSKLADFSGLKDIEVFEDSEGVTISFKNKLLFESGSAELTNGAKETLNSVIAQIRGTIADSPLIIEGHTDDRPLNSKTYRDNWDLSAARAVAVLRIFEAAGFPAGHLSAVGMGSSRPLAPNRDANGEPISENMDLTRRVVIRVHFAKVVGEPTTKSGAESSSKL